MRYVIEPEAFKLLKQNSFPLPAFRFVKDAGQLKEAIKEIGYPAAMKIVSKDIIHKSDIGGVKLNLNNMQALRDAYEEIMDNAKTAVPTGQHLGVLLTPMMKEGIEVIVGIGVDVEFGKYIMFGLGGVHVELYKDVSFRILPLETEEAAKMVEEIKGGVLLKGYRGASRKDVDALVKLLVKCCQFSLANPNVREMDLNPVVVHEQGVCILDACMFREQTV